MWRSLEVTLNCTILLLPARSSCAGVDVVPTFTTSNARLCLLLPDGRYGLLRMEDAERLQVRGEGEALGVTWCVVGVTWCVPRVAWWIGYSWTCWVCVLGVVVFA
jgi:hypothetical protein